jgi:hypothetical protein
LNTSRFEVQYQTLQDENNGNRRGQGFERGGHTMILLQLRQTPDGLRAYRPTTKERGTIDPANIPPRYRREVEEKGKAVAVVDNKTWKMAVKI